MRILYGKGRVSWIEIENPKLHRMVFKEFEGDEIQMEAEFRRRAEKIHADEQAMLHGLIDIRPGLGT